MNICPERGRLFNEFPVINTGYATLYICAVLANPTGSHLCYYLSTHGQDLDLMKSL